MSYRPKIYDRGVVCAGGWLRYWLHPPECAMCADVRDRFWSPRARSALGSAGCRRRWGSPGATLVQPAGGWKGIRDGALGTSSFGPGRSSAPCGELPLFAAPTQTQSMQPLAPKTITATRMIRMIVAGAMPLAGGCAMAYGACGWPCGVGCGAWCGCIA